MRHLGTGFDLHAYTPVTQHIYVILLCACWLVLVGVCLPGCAVAVPSDRASAGVAHKRKHWNQLSPLHVAVPVLAQPAGDCPCLHSPDCHHEMWIRSEKEHSNGK